MFGKKPTPAEAVRAGRRDITHASRDIDREIVSLQSEEKKLLLEVKKAARTGNQTATRQLAKELVRLRAQVSKLQATKTHLRGISTRVQTAHSSTIVAGAMGQAGSVMKAANAQLNPAEAANVAAHFQREAALMDHAGEALEDSLEGVLDSEDLDEESDAVTAQVLDELGVETSAQLASAPRVRVAGAKEGVAQAGFNEAEEDDLQKRFAALLS